MGLTSQMSSPSCRSVASWFFPSAIVPLLISRGSSLKVVEQALAGDRMLALTAQKKAEEEDPPPEALYARANRWPYP